MKVGKTITIVAARWWAIVVVFVGCARGPAAVELPSVDGSDVAAFAMEHFDTNHDGAINASEMAGCPPLVVALASYDADRNGELTAEEINARITSLYGPSAALTSVDCVVTLNGRPVQGATVKFRPVEMLGSSVKPAQGVTDQSGIARMALGDDNLPDDLKGTALMHPGLYHVEITHPQIAIPASYNTATTLGFEVDPSQRSGTSARFDLKSK
jgi:hypothetical protein